MLSAERDSWLFNCSVLAFRNCPIQTKVEPVCGIRHQMSSLKYAFYVTHELASYFNVTLIIQSCEAKDTKK